MKIRAKILLVTLPISLAILALSFGVTFYASRLALRSLASYNLESKANEASKIAFDVETEIEKYNEALAVSGNAIRVDSAQGLAQTRRAIEKIKIGENGSVSIIRFDGTILSHPDQNLLGQNVSGKKWFNDIRRLPKGTVVFKLGSVDYLGSYTKFESWNWYLLAAQPLSEIYGVVETSDRYVLVIVLVGALILSLSLLTLSKSISDPIQQLYSGAQAIGDGNLGVRISVNSQDEIGNLASAFNEMTTRLQKSIWDQENIANELINLNQSLETKVKERTQELRDAQASAIGNAHAAGMAEIATGVLHNVGNILNSANVSAEHINKILKDSKVSSFSKANDLLRANIKNLGKFFSTPKAKALAEYYLQIDPIVTQEQKSLGEEVERIQKQMDLIKEVIQMQQAYAKTGLMMEEVPLYEIVEEFLTLEQGTIGKHHIKVIRNFSGSPIVQIQKTKVAHILFNLTKNAIQAMEHLPQENRILELSVENKGDVAILKFRDNGIGIEPQDKVKIFSHGFTTRKQGHGFGLHYCANAMTEMGGKLTVESDGRNQGTCFIIQFDLKSKMKKAG